MKQHRPRKRFGQNFLHDAAVLQRIVTAIDPRSGQTLVEIGPGLGALTRQVLPLAGELTVIELDRDLVPLLQQNCTGLGSLTIHSADALKFDFCTLKQNENQLRLFGNLPYNISTPLLFHLFRQLSCIQDMHFMLQKELVERMTAAPGNKTYGRLSVMVQFHCRVEMLFIIGPEAFRPAPKVDSAVIRLIPHAEPPVEITAPDTFSRLVTQAFSQRRKTLRNTLKKLLTSEQISSAGIDPTTRAEQLSLQDFALLANLVDSPPPQ